MIKLNFIKKVIHFSVCTFLGVIDLQIYLRIVASIIIFFRRYSSQRAIKISPIDGIAIIAITIISGAPKERPNPELPLFM